MSSQSTTDGQMTLTITFQLGTDLDKAQVLVQNRVAIAEPRLPEDVRRIGVTTLKSSPDLLMVVHLLSPEQALRPALHRQLRAHPGARRAPAHRRRRRRHPVRAARVQHARLARSRSGSRAATSRPATSSRRCASRTSRSPRASSGSRRSPRATRSSSRSRRSAACSSPSSSRTSSSRPAPTAASRASATSRASSSGRATTRSTATSTTSRRWRWRSRSARARTRSRPPTRSRHAMEELSQELPRGARVPHRLQPDDLRPRVDQRGDPHAVRGGRAGRDRRARVPADLAREPDPAARDSRSRWSARSRRWRRSASR